MNRSERGQSEVIGVVLLLGITVAAVTATVATGSVALGLITDEARSSGVENGMSQLSSQSSLVALGETDARRFDLGSVDGGQLRLNESAGHVEVRIENGTDGETTVYNDSIGTLEYVGEERTVALQGGGVWTSSNGYGRMISPPEYHYRGTTLTFPIVRLTGTEQTPQRGTGTVSRSAGDPDAVTATRNPLENGTVVVEVQSDYYEGWYEFFSQRADGSVTKYDANQTTVARLVVPDEVTFDRPLSVTTVGGYSHKGGSDKELSETQYKEDVTVPSPNAHIADMVELASDDNDNSDESCVNTDGFDGCGTIGPGTYYFDNDPTVNDDLDFDTTDGDVTVVVDGDFNIGSNNLTIVDDSDNSVTYYINGSLDLQGDPFVGTEEDSIDADRTQFYVAEGFLDGSGGDGNPTIEAIVYAPNADVETRGNPTLRGAFVTNSLETRGNPQLEYDTDLAEMEITITGGTGQNPITYLHVSENVVEVEFD
ncbi:DUF7289 family protein [Halorubrum pallidum]|uniref:Archaellin/type IV pilin N-terminal domain-containing protein n=1 Tax=Halorubrum pallidum TaxID=1526114 RepID=A0ABD5T9N3_9EURY